MMTPGADWTEVGANPEGKENDHSPSPNVVDPPATNRMENHTVFPMAL
jgi:hypothetical protein